MLTEEEAVRKLREYFESLFPKDCPNCNRRFPTLREYIEVTQRVGPARSFDADSGDWRTKRPVGTVVLANCPCGSTLALSTENMLLSDRLAMLDWVRLETCRRSVSASEVLEHLRNQVRQQVLDEGSEEA